MFSLGIECSRARTIPVVTAGPPSTAATVAGSGLSGNADGPAARASFTEPFGIAVAKDGTIFVSDIGGQRIRAIRRGAVSTLAGGGEPPTGSGRVPGGFRDGRASEARFNRPMGLALLPDGTLLVADAWNHCIRAIRGGVVSTLAGKPDRAGTSDGLLKDATFMEPRALTVDPSGVIFVADRGINGAGGGLRKITPQGLVSTVTLPAGINHTIVGATAGLFGGQLRLYLSNLQGILEVDPRDGAHAVAYAEIAEGPRILGYPDSLLNAGEAVVFTDARTHAVRIFRRPVARSGRPSSQPLNAPRPMDASDNGGGFRNGPTPGALFDSPRGIARDVNGDLLVCDSGNRRVRRIASPDLRKPWSVPALSEPRNRTLIVGGSALFFDTLWSSSIPGRLESALSGPVDAMQYDDTAPAEILRDVRAVSNSGAKNVIWLVSTRELDALGDAGLRSALSEFGRSSSRALVGILPYSNEIGPAARYAGLALGDPREDEAKGRRHYAILQKSVKQSRVRAVDIAEPMLRYMAVNSRGAAYAVAMPYLTNIGRDVAARSLAAGVSPR